MAPLARRSPQEMRTFVGKLAAIRKNEDPRMSFTTPEFKDSQRQFQEHFKARAPSTLRERSLQRADAPRGARVCPRGEAHWLQQKGVEALSRTHPSACLPVSQKNFGRPIEYGLVKRYPVSTRDGSSWGETRYTSFPTADSTPE